MNAEALVRLRITDMIEAVIGMLNVVVADRVNRYGCAFLEPAIRLRKIVAAAAKCLDHHWIELAAGIVFDNIDRLADRYRMLRRERIERVD